MTDIYVIQRVNHFKIHLQYLILVPKPQIGMPYIVLVYHHIHLLCFSSICLSNSKQSVVCAGYIRLLSWWPVVWDLVFQELMNFIFLSGCFLWNYIYIYIYIYYIYIYIYIYMPSPKHPIGNGDLFMVYSISLWPSKVCNCKAVKFVLFFLLFYIHSYYHYY